MFVSRWFSVMKQLLHSYFQWVIAYGSTKPSLHWDALMLKGFHVRSLSEQHDTLHHPSGEFFWKFCVYMALLC